LKAGWLITISFVSSFRQTSTDLAILSIATLLFTLLKDAFQRVCALLATREIRPQGILVFLDTLQLA
jgi:hypothetical protein